jgi:[ribosomal protein S5]-alanine N-acetyltransferase
VPPLLQTDRLSLRPLQPGDAEQLWQVWNDPAVFTYVGTGEVPDLDRVRRGVDHSVAHWAEHGWGPFLVTRGADGEVIGECGLYPVFDDRREDTGEIELGHRYGKAAWGQGYGGEAAGAVMTWARDELHLTELVSIIQEPNIASRRIAESLGFTLGEVRSVQRGDRTVRICWYRWSG